MMTDRRGVSETLSFVFVFTLIVATVGIVSTVGLADLQSIRDAEQVNNVEHAFDLLADNVDELVSRSAPSRGTEMRLQGGTLSSGDPVTFNVSGDYRNGSTDSEDFTTGRMTVVPIVYNDTETDTRIRYEGGAVIRAQDDGAVLVRRPSFVIDDDRLVIPVVTTNAADRAVGGRTTVFIRTENKLTDLLVTRTERYDQVTLTVTSPQAATWETYFSARGMNCSLPSPDRVSCTIDDVDRIYVAQVSVGVAFE